MFKVTFSNDRFCCCNDNHWINNASFSPNNLKKTTRKLQENLKKTLSSTISNVRGLPRFKVPISSLTFGPFFSWSRYFLRSALAWLSLNFKWVWDFLNFHTAVPGPFMVVYLPIRKRSFSVNLVLTLFDFFSKVPFKLSYSITPKLLSSRVGSEDDVPAEKKNIKI